jgi:GxxExxY protein
MPILPSISLRRIPRDEFGAMSFEVMSHVFEMHNSFGRLFDERIYKRELARRLPSVRLEGPIDVRFDSFAKRYLLDVLLGGAALFEFKAAEAIVPRHRAQTLHYLMLADLGHAKLINMRPESVEHEFVNSAVTTAERRSFHVNVARWERDVPGAVRVEEILVALLRDWGAGLELALYEEAIMHFLGGPLQVEREIAIEEAGVSLGVQRFRMAAPDVAFKLTALTDRFAEFEEHTRRLLSHTRLQAILWINLTVSEVRFTAIR